MWKATNFLNISRISDSSESYIWTASNVQLIWNKYEPNLN